MANLGYAENPQPLWVFGGRRVAPGQRPPLTTRTPSRPWISGAWASWPLTSAPTDPCVSALSLLCRPFPLRSLRPWVGVAPQTSPPRQSYRVSPPSQIWPSPCGPAVNSPQSQRFRLGSPEWGPICSELRAHLRTLNPGGLGLQCEFSRTIFLCGPWSGRLGQSGRLGLESALCLPGLSPVWPRILIW